MDGFEAARIVFSRIQKLVSEPESASKIIGLLLLKDHGEQEMIRLACSPDSHLHSVILNLKSDLALSSSPPFQLNHLDGGVVDDETLSFLDDAVVESRRSNPNSSDVEFLHRRSYSVNDVALANRDLGGEDGGGSGWKQCLYFVRGFCKNGSACRFLHSHGGDFDGLQFMDSAANGTAAEVMEQQRHQLLRSKSFNPRLAGSSPFLHASSLPSDGFLNDKYVNFLLQNQLADSPRSMCMGDDLQELGQTGFERSHFHVNGGMDMVNNPGSRQIYLTFPADSSFREEDVSNYFSIFGPVQDVRIPYQQKRMFGFVTFVYPETVKIILAKGNPHFVCDARVLVKPYKEKGKIPDRYRSLQPLNVGDHFMCNSPTGLGQRDPFDNQTTGPGMFSNQDILWRRKLEEHADLQQAIERQSQRLMGMRLLDASRQHHQRAFSMGGMAIPSPTHAGSYLSRSFASSSASSSPDSTDGNYYSPKTGKPPSFDPEMHLLKHLSVGANKEGKLNYNTGNIGFTGKDSSEIAKNGDLPESVNPEQYLPESPFTSAGEVAVHTTAQTEPSNDIPTTFPASKNLTPMQFNPAASTLEMAKSCYLQLPRLSASHGQV